MAAAVATVALAALAVIAAACGGDSGRGNTGDLRETPVTEMPESSGGDTDEVQADVTIEIEAKDTRYVPDDIEVPAGKTVRLVLKNSDAGTDHDLQAGTIKVRRVEGGAMGDEHGGGHGGGGALALHAVEGESSEIVFVADAPGTYDIFCTVDDHRERGMVGRIRVV